MPELTVRAVTEADAGLLLALAHRCPPLDIHTPYTYWVLSHLFGRQCFIALDGAEPVGFVTSVAEGTQALLWQVGVIDSHRGRGVSQLLIDAVVGAARESGLRSVELSIDPTNANSLGAFRSYAKKHGLLLDRIGEVDLTDERNPGFHEFEDLYSMELPG